MTNTHQGDERDDDPAKHRELVEKRLGELLRLFGERVQPERDQRRREGRPLIHAHRLGSRTLHCPAVPLRLPPRQPHAHVASARAQSGLRASGETHGAKD
eukprot:167899-Rhodomonas_salina.1